MSSSSSAAVDAELTFILPKGADVNLRVMSTTESKSWRWSSSSSSTLASAPAPSNSDTFAGPGDIDIWLRAGKSIILKLEES